MFKQQVEVVKKFEVRGWLKEKLADNQAVILKLVLKYTKFNMSRSKIFLVALVYNRLRYVLSLSKDVWVV